MTNWLVLGSGQRVQAVVSSLDDRPGTVRVGTANDTLATNLREEGIEVEHLDPTTTSELQQFDDVDIVCVYEDSAEDTQQITEAARAAIPAAYLLVYVETEDDAVLEAITQRADRVVDSGGIVARHIMNRIGDENRRSRQLWQVLRDVERLAIVTHDNPDPDAIASGIALAALAEAAGCTAEVCYFGEITHQENRAFVNVLDLDLRNPDTADEILDEFDGIALVDHSRPGVNDQLPTDLVVDIVIDHHPPRAPVDARFVDLRSNVGATSTLLVEYLETFGVDYDATVATALLFGIHVDTREFSREVAVNDFEAAAVLVEQADLQTLERIRSPSISPQTYDTIGRAIQRRRVDGHVLHSFVGRTADRDALAQAAERMLSLNGVDTTMVYGIMEGTVYVSARSRSNAVDIGETLREAFEQIGNAGGHVDMAGAQITLGVLEAVEADEESLHEIIEEVIAKRFLEAVETATGAQITDAYASDLGTGADYSSFPEQHGEGETSQTLHPFARIIEERGTDKRIIAGRESLSGSDDPSGETTEGDQSETVEETETRDPASEADDQ